MLPAIMHPESVPPENEWNHVGVNSPLWVIWWQGCESMPPLVQACYRNMLKHGGTHPVILITQENWQEYCTIPAWIADKVHKGEIDLTHLTDLARLSLLSQYGGIYLDSTLWLAADVPSYIATYPFYTATVGASYLNNGKWATFFQCSGAGNPLVQAVLDYHYAYWQHETSAIQYLMFDCMIMDIYQSSCWARRMIDAVPANNQNLYTMQQQLNEPADTFNWCGTEQQWIQKLQRRKQYRELTENGQITVYGHMLELAQE